MNKGFLGLAIAVGSLWAALTFIGGMPMVGGFLISHALLGVVLIISVIAIWKELEDAVYMIAFYMIATIMIIGGVMYVTTTGMFHSTSYRNILKVVPVKAGIPVLEWEHATLVTPLQAMKAAEQRLSDQNLGGKYQIEKLTKQLVNNKLVYVGFLEFRGFWDSVNGVAPGYVVVSAENIADTQLVTANKAGAKLNMAFIESSAFFKDAAWMLRSDNLFQLVTDYSAEIDEEGNPFLVATVYKNTVGVEGQVATGVKILDVQTGSIKQYDIQNTPAWVDRIQPKEIIHSQINDYGEFVHGWSVGNLDKTKAAEDPTLVYSNGKAFWYTPVTSIGKDEGTIGYFITDSRTGESSFVTKTGSVPSLVEKAFEATVAEKKWDAAYPLPFFIGEREVYVSVLSDAQGIIRAYGVADYANRQVVVVEASKQKAVQAYLQAIGKSEKVVVANAVNTTTVKNSIAKISHIVEKGNTVIYMILKGSNQIFMVNVDQHEYIPFLVVGDTVSLSFNVSGDKVIVPSKVEIGK